MKINLYEINDEELFLWDTTTENATDLAKEMGVDVRRVKKLHDNDIILILSEDERTGEMEWVLDDGNPKIKPIRVTTVKKLSNILFKDH